MKLVFFLASMALVSLIGLTGISVGYWAVYETDACHQRAAPLVGSWSPLDGCSVTILGTPFHLPEQAPAPAYTATPTHWDAQRGYY